MGRLWAYSGLVLSKVSVTSARPFGPRDSEPLKITSSMALPRRCLALCSPRTQRIESTMFDLPQPLGPTMPTTSWSKWITVRSTKDLKPVISNFLMCIDKLPSAERDRLIAGHAPESCAAHRQYTGSWHGLYGHVASPRSTLLNGCIQDPSVHASHFYKRTLRPAQWPLRVIWRRLRRFGLRARDRRETLMKFPPLAATDPRT